MVVVVVAEIVVVGVVDVVEDEPVSSLQRNSTMDSPRFVVFADAATTRGRLTAFETHQYTTSHTSC